MIKVYLELDQKALGRALTRLQRYEGRAFGTRVSRAYLEGAKLLVAPIRAKAPKGPTGNLRKSISARDWKRLRGHEVAVVSVGPRAPHRHLVIRGHRIVTPGGRDTGRTSRANPFVDEAVRPLLGQVQAFIASRALAEDVRSF